MANERKAQLGVTVDATGAKTGFDQVKQEAQSMAKSVAESGAQAGKAIDGIGNGGDGSAKKVDAATKSMIQSIQRTTAVMEAGSRSSSKYFETLATQRGVDINALKPYLAQLDAVAEKQKTAEQALNDTTPALNNVGASAKQTAFAMRQLPAQFNDIIVSLQGGQRPLTVFMQQGSQIRDMFGGIGPAAKAMGGYILGLVNPFTLAAAAGAGLAFAASRGREEFNALNNTMKLTGGYTGQTTKQITDMAARLGTASGNVSEATEALRLLIATGRVGGDQLEGFGRVAMQMAKATGGSVKDAVASLAGLSDDAVKWAEKYNEQFHFMTAAQYNLAKQYADTGDKAAATKVVIESLQEAHTRMFTKASDELGTLERYVSDWERGYYRIKQAVLSIGKPDSNFDKINAALKERETGEKLLKFYQDAHNDQEVSRLTKLLELNKDYINSLREKGQEERAQAEKQKALAEEQERSQRLGKYVDDPTYADKKTKYALEVQRENKAFAEAVKGFEKTSADYERALARHKANLAQIAEQNKDKKPISDEVSDYDRLSKVIGEKMALETAAERSTAKLTEAEKIRAKMIADLGGGVIHLTEKEKALANARLDVLDTMEKSRQAQADVAKIYAEYNDQAQKSIANAIKEAEDNERLASTYGMTKSEIERMTLARLEAQLAQRASLGLTLDEIQTLEKLIEAKKRSIAAIESVEVRDASKKAAEKSAEEWKRSFEDVSRSLTDAIMRGGKSAGEYLRDYFRTLVLRPVVQAIMAPVAGTIASAFMPSAAQAAGLQGGGLGSAMSLYSAGKSLWEGFSTGFSGLQSTITGYAQSGINMFGVNTGSYAGIGAPGPSALASGIGTAGAYAGGIIGGYSIGNMISGDYGSKYVTAGGTAAGALIGAQIGSIGGPLGALIGGVAGGILNRAFGMGEKETQRFGIEGDFTSNSFSGRNFADWHQDGGWFRGDDNGTDYSALDPTLGNMLKASVTALTTQTADMVKALGLSSDALDGYTKHIRVELTKDQEKNQQIITDLFTSIGDELASKVASFDEFAKAGETAGVTLQRLATSLTTANSWLSLLREQLFQVSLAGGDAASKLADAFGGIENLNNASDAFYQTYYTEAERAADSTAAMGKALAEVGLAMPKTKDELRAMAASLDLNTDAGRKAYAVLLSIAPEFANVAEVTSRLAKETASKLLAAYTGDGNLVPVLDATQQASAVLSAQIDTLRYNARNVSVDMSGLSAALSNVDTETFINTVSLVFENLGNRIKSVIGSITDERSATRDAALNIINPSVMSKEAILSQISGINTALPSKTGIASIEAQYALVAQLKSQQDAALVPYQSVRESLDKLASAYAATRLDQKQMVLYKDSVPTVNADLYASNSAYKQAWDTLLEQHIKRFRTGYTTASDGNAVNNALLQMLAPTIEAENAAYQQRFQQQSAAVESLKANYQAATDALTSAQTAAAENAKAAQMAYAKALQEFAADASKSVGKLTRLREETVRYYEAAKQLADLMTNSAAGLRKSLNDYRYGQLSPEEQFAALRSQFSAAYSMALSTDGNVLASYADKLNSLIGPLLEKANEVYGGGADYNTLVASVFASAQNIAGRLDSLAPTGYEEDSLQMLAQIDATLVALDSAARSADKLIVDAINASRDQTVGGLRAIVAALTGQSIPAFATGGVHAGGWRLVGEDGPEIEATGPARYFSASQTSSILAGAGNAELVAEVRALRAEVANLRIEARATATYTAKTARQLERFEIDGLTVKTDADTPLQTEAV